MASKQKLLFILLWQLFAFGGQLVLAQDEPEAQQLQVPRPRGRIRIADMQPPPLAPVGPMNWPTYGVAPAPMPATSTVHAHIPLLREQITSSSTASVPLSLPLPNEEGGVQESVVYGNWKPEHPLQPQEEETQPKQRVYGRLEAMLMGMPAEAMDRRDVSSEELEAQSEQRTAAGGYQNPYARQESYERAQNSGHRRWRPPMPNGFKESKLQPKPQYPPQTESQTSFEVIHLNASDPILKAMAKQINESIETTTTRRQATHTTEDNWMPLPYPYPTHSYESTQPVPGAALSSTISRVRSTEAATQQPTQRVESTTIALNWPTDFLDASPSSTPRTYTDSGISIDRVDNIDSIDRIDDDVVDHDDYKYYEDSLSSAQMHSELSVPETLIPHLPLNITRVGIPYEDRNSLEEPTICVPLTVTETASESATPLLVEVERVYCFPLPKVEVRTGTIKRQQHPELELEQEQERHDNGTSLPAEEPQPAVTAGACSRYNFLAVLLIIGSSILTRF
ncbi:uncharacterized protein LOC117566697 [Drosophila albomicans]|uniref:Uncharacterized protein LOC117566697 n=1 Tax=Drosophila albomicans TaxID=7291 RepID=A0A6P8WFD1_DROAB|nr:uncharacterized protein LOC117566697 [Drosophila albomicans]XP_051861088.1 uncharacterized protein LOC117566697 [Drosophila albomicans]XP_051861089.1 uncharacterized protein LOC117566697 [Drosophila albomicans]